MLIVFFSFSEIPVLLTLLVPPALNDVPLVTNIWLLFRRNLTFSSCPHPKSAVHNIRIDAAFVDLSQLTSTSRHVASPRAGLTLMKYRAGRPGQTQQLSCPNGRRHIYLLSCVELLGGRSQLMTGRLATHPSNTTVKILIMNVAYRCQCTNAVRHAPAAPAAHATHHGRTATPRPRTRTVYGASCPATPGRRVR